MEFRGLETIVVDVLRTPEIQRLRRIRQLGLGHYVFPGAEHSRLVHSLGAAWLAVRFARQLREAARDYLPEALRPSENAIADLALAALCHDLGHGPLSHAWEREIIGNNFDREGWCQTLAIPERLRALFAEAQWHEITTAGFLFWDEGQLHRLLEETSKGSSERIVRLLRGRYWLEYLPGLLSSDIDVDRADYIRRDTHQSGVAYGRYDLDWLVSTCTVGELTNGDWVVGFDARKAPRVIEQFLIARIALYETVYCHKTVRAAEGMVKALFRRLKDLAGSFTDVSQGNKGRGFMRHRDGNIIVFDAPNASNTSASSINNRGDIVGAFADLRLHAHGYIRDHEGNITVFDAPDAVQTTAVAINDRAATLWDLTSPRHFLRIQMASFGTGTEISPSSMPLTLTWGLLLSPASTTVATLPERSMTSGFTHMVIFETTKEISPSSMPPTPRIPVPPASTTAATSRDR